MPLYVALIYEREADYAEGGQETYDKVMQAHVDFAAKHGSKLRGGHALQPTATATSIEYRPGTRGNLGIRHSSVPAGGRCLRSRPTMSFRHQKTGLPI